jgi:hypothetical protein
MKFHHGLQEYITYCLHIGMMAIACSNLIPYNFAACPQQFRARTARAGEIIDSGWYLHNIADHSLVGHRGLEAC